MATNSFNDVLREVYFCYATMSYTKYELQHIVKLIKALVAVVGYENTIGYRFLSILYKSTIYLLCYNFGTKTKVESLVKPIYILATGIVKSYRGLKYL